ncbi:MAG: class I SAM-dependent methyltransferase [Candidatus Entotheonellia bacterium]
MGGGTGRVLVSWAGGCGDMPGLDLSEAMSARCRRQLEAAGIAATKAHVAVKDITHVALNQTFDLRIAPYRVRQNLATDAAETGLFRGIRQHLRPGGAVSGRCVARTASRHMAPSMVQGAGEVVVGGRRRGRTREVSRAPAADGPRQDGAVSRVALPPLPWQGAGG